MFNKSAPKDHDVEQNAKPQAARRHPLLLYKRLFDMIRMPSFLIAGLCGVLWWFAPGNEMLGSDAVQTSLIAVGAVTGFLFLYALIGPRLSYVQCQPNYLFISTPFYRLAISYGRIRVIRSRGFTPPTLRWSQRDFVAPFLGQQCIVVELSSYPVNEAVLRVLLNEFMFPHDGKGFQFVTADWMALSRDLETGRSTWRMRNRREVSFGR